MLFICRVCLAKVALIIDVVGNFDYSSPIHYEGSPIFIRGSRVTFATNKHRGEGREFLDCTLIVIGTLEDSFF